ncbi:MAG TPA: AAA family ATPase [Acidobacteriaceae bacterium]|nr:AAA family ATPase [Acidobacteriaceae bacterium]
MLRRLVLVTGPPASGKSTLVQPLAAALGFALLSKDDIKESLFTSLHAAPNDPEVSRQLSHAATNLLWALAPRCPQLVLEANFRTRDPRERAHLSALLALPNTSAVEVHCCLPLEEASRRFAERARTERHHPAHPLHQMSVEQLAEFADPFEITAVIEVDMLRPIAPPDLAQLVRAILDAERPR